MAKRFQRITRANIRRLTVGLQITEHGVSADRLSNGDIRYSINIMVDGERIHRVVGKESDGTTRTQAEEYITKLRAEARDGRLKLPSGRKIHLTFSNASKIYLESEIASGGNDFDTKTRHLRLHLNPYFGSMRVDRISSFTVEKFRNEYRRKGFAEGGINRILATFRHLGNRLSEHGHIPSPLPMVKLRRVDNRPRRILSQGEEDLLLEAAQADQNDYCWLFIKLGLSTGMRHREILGARFDGLDASRKRLRVRVRGGRWRDQPLPAEIVEILLRERKTASDTDGWIFPNSRSTNGNIQSMKKPFRRCVERCGLDPAVITPHTMRHTAITKFAETGVDIRTVQEFSGHQTLEMAMRYTHARDERVDDAIERMQKSKTKAAQIDRESINDR